MKLIVTGISVVLASLLMTGCGGSGGETATTPTANPVAAPSLSGVVAIGVGVEADLVLIGALGNRITEATDASGVYSIDTSSLTQPIMVQAIIRSTGNIMYSFAEVSTGTVNVTPLTTFIVDQAAEAANLAGGASQLFQNFTDNAVAAQAELAGATETLDAEIASVMEGQTVGGFNHITDDFVANHTGYDAVLDALDIEMYQDDVVIRIDGTTTLDTINYPLTTQTIVLQGSLVDPYTMAPIVGATVTLVDSAATSLTSVTDLTGSFSVTVDTMRTYDVTFTAAGYETMFFPEVPSFVFTDLGMGEIPMMPTSAIANTTTVSGNVFDGRTAGTTISQATLNFRAGYNARVGDIISTQVTDASGNYTANDLPSGPYTVEVISESFENAYIDIEAYGATLTHSMPIFAGAQSTSAVATIVLSWGENPYDLDSHLTGDTNTTERFHSYYSNKVITDSTFTPVDPYAVLEPVTDTVTGFVIDYTNGTITDPATGMYGYGLEMAIDPVSGLTYHMGIYVDEFTNVVDVSLIDATTLARFTAFGTAVATIDPVLINPNYIDPEAVVLAEDPCAVPGVIASLDRDDTSSFGPETMSLCSVQPNGMYKYYVHHFGGTGTMAESPASVTVTTASGANRTFNAPVTDSIGDNDIWHVFNVDADGNIYPVNTIIGNDYSSSTLFAAPALNQDSRFSSETGLMDNLPSK